MFSFLLDSFNKFASFSLHFSAWAWCPKEMGATSINAAIDPLVKLEILDSSQNWNYQIWIKIEQKLGIYFSKLGNIKFQWIATCNKMDPRGGNVGFAITEKFTCRFCNFPAFVVFLLLEREGTHLSWRCQLSNQSENEAISWKFFF